MPQTTSHSPKNGASAGGSNSNGSKRINLIPFATGFAVATLMQRGCSNESKNTPADTLSNLNGNHNLILGEEVALQHIDSGTFSKQVKEVTTIGAPSSIFVFNNARRTDELSLLKTSWSSEQRDEFLKSLEKRGAKVELSLSTESSAGATPIKPLLNQLISTSGFIIGLSLLGYGMYRAASILARSIRNTVEDTLKKVQCSLESNPKERFENYGGNFSIVAEAKELVNNIRKIRTGKAKVDLPSGIIYEGPTGTGKSLLARTIAGEAGCPVMILNAGALFSSPYQGAWTEAIEAMFKEARKVISEGTKLLRAHPKSNGKEQDVLILVLEEIDAIAKRRSPSGQIGHLEYEKALNALLHETDSSDPLKNRGLIIIGTTNKYESLDEALLRPGRLDERKTVDLLSTTEERIHLLRIVERNIYNNYQMKIERRTDLIDIARICPPIAAAFLADILSTARKMAQDNNSKVITTSDIWEAFQRVQVGPPITQEISKKKLRLVTAHEDGHAIMALACGVIPKVRSLVPRGNSLARVFVETSSMTEQPMTRDDLLRAMLIAAGGRAGEVVFGGSGQSTLGVLGKDGDFQRLNDYARLFLGAGFADNTFATSLGNLNRHELHATDIDRVETIGDLVVKAAIDILRTLEDNKRIFSSIVKGNDNQDPTKREWVGPETKAYYKQFLKKEDKTRITEMANKFIKEIENRLKGPLWSNGTTTTSTSGQK